MASIKVFAACRMRAFASLVAQHFSVQVRLRGKEILVQYSKPPVIFLPALEYANDKDLLPIYGFCLHEAAHLKHTRQNVARKCPNYLQKMLHNALEDTYIERRLESDFPGARELLLRAYTDGVKQVLGDKPIVEPVSYLAPEAAASVAGIMGSLGMNTEDEHLRRELAKRLEIERVARLWIVESRQYPLPLYDWLAHPWREVFQEETLPLARSTAETYAQAQRIIARLDIKPILPNDVRPIEMIADAKAKRAAVRAIKEAIRELTQSRKAEIEKQMSRTLEQQALNEAKEGVGAAARALEDAERTATSDESDEAQRQIEAAEVRLSNARQRESDAQRDFDQRLDDIRRGVVERFNPEIETKRVELQEKAKSAIEAIAEAKKAAAEIAAGDAKVDEPIMPGFLKKLAEAVFQAFRSESSGDELQRLVENADTDSALDAGGPIPTDTAKYSVYDRSFDCVVPVLPTSASGAEYAKYRQQHAAVISSAIERLRKLHAPRLSHLKTNSERGRIDPK